MKAERWQKINDLFQTAFERAPEERSAYLDQACGGDEELHREVVSLITSYEQSTDFIEAPAFAVSPELLAEDATGALVGKAFGHYRVESLIGAGGMGEVYLARDEMLGRKVALKLLPAHLTGDEAQLGRLKSEARTASALNHPNILTVYEIGAEGGRQFIATEFIEGVTVRTALASGRIPLPDVLDVGVQVASALAAAHEIGVVHRDIKPENIMWRPDGYAKVLDFGIAKLGAQTPWPEIPGNGAAASPRLTGVGTFLGTPSYVSPEQARGEEADARSDIWSLGVVLYEMVGGTAPFAGETPHDCMLAILNTEPPPLSDIVPDIPTRLQSIVQKALRKDPGERHQTIREMLSDLRDLKGALEVGNHPAARDAGFVRRQGRRRAALVAAGGAILLATALIYTHYFTNSAPAPDTKSIAVLPFVDLSPAHDQRSFCDGIQQEIITSLTKIADLKVISRNSTLRYRRVPANLPEIAKQLEVANILEGTVQKEGDQVRVNVELINARSDSHLWAEKYDRKMIDVFRVESEIAQAIAETLRAKLTGSEQRALATRPTTNPEAYILYLRALPYERGPDTLLEDYQRAVALYEQAIQLDPDFALARAHLASTCAEIFHFHDPLDRWKDRARREASAALRLRPELGEAHFAFGQCAYWFDQDYERALAEFTRAQSDLPNDSNIGAYVAAIRRRQGRWEEALATYERMEKLDPQNPNIIRNVLFTNGAMRRWPQAALAAARFRAVAPDSVVAKIQAAYVEFQWKADIGALQRSLANIPAGEDPDGLVTCMRWESAMLQRDFAGAANVLARSRRTEVSYLSGGLQPKSYLAGIAALARDDRGAARENFAAALPDFEKAVQEAAGSANCHANLGLIYAFMAKREEAIREGRLAAELKPLAKDANDGAIVLCYLALIYARLGENDAAIPLIERLLKTPGAVDSVDYSITPNDLRFRWEWDRLRSDPRFQKLLAQP
ncbi:MAG TPA: protein kinase [Chthoniobacterales bacterium]|nr:protein kinase [Chthoniobacterales bacterium]